METYTVVMSIVIIAQWLFPIIVLLLSWYWSWSCRWCCYCINPPNLLFLLLVWVPSIKLSLVWLKLGGFNLCLHSSLTDFVFVQSFSDVPYTLIGCGPWWYNNSLDLWHQPSNVTLYLFVLRVYKYREQKGKVIGPSIVSLDVWTFHLQVS